MKSTEMNLAIAQLRHLYKQMIADSVKDQSSTARVLLGPAIELLESAVMPTQSERYDLVETARILNLSRTTVYDRISRGLLRVIKDGARVFVTHAEIERYIATCGPGSYR